MRHVLNSTDRTLWPDGQISVQRHKTAISGQTGWMCQTPTEHVVSELACKNTVHSHPHKHEHTHAIAHNALSSYKIQYVLTFSLGTDQAGRGVTEWAQNGSYGQAQVLVARVQSDRGETQVWQAGSLLRTNLYVRDLLEKRPGETLNKESKCAMIKFFV